MKKILIINFVLVSVLTISYSYSQCAYDNVIYLTWTAPATVGASQTTACIYGGEYNRVTGMVAGYTYRIQTCGDTDFDTQITIYPAGGGGVAGFNDDGCSLQSTIDFTPIVGGDYDILVDEWDCISNSICMTLSIQLVSTPGCPTVGFYRYPDHVSLTSVSPFTCDQEFWITAFDSIDAGGYDKPGWSVVINPTDANSTTQNSIEFFADGVSIGGWAPTDIFSPDFYGGTIDNNMIMTFYADGFDPNVFWSFEWCDNGPSGTFPYLVYDHANLSTPVTTGTFDHNGGTNCFSVNIGYLNGIADFTGPGIVYDIGDGWAYFDAAAAGPGTHTITYCWDNENGCSDCASQTITVNGPTASAGPAKAVCQGSSVAIGGSPTATGGVAGYTYQWSPSTGLSNTTIANPTATPNSTTTYTVTVTDAGGSGCTATSSVTVTVYSKPTASVSPDPAATCAGVGFQLNGNPTPGSGVITGHSWTGNTSPLSSTAIVNPIFNTSTAGIYNLTYTVTDNNGCTGSDNISVTVYQNPASAITPDPATVCAGSNLTLFGNPSGGTGIYTHSWTGGGAIYLNNVNISTPVFNCSTAGTYNLTYTVTDSYGCQSTDVITVTVNSKPAAGITPDPASVCAGANLTLNGNPSGGVSPYSHLWTGTSTMYLSSTSIASPVFSSPVATTYNYTYTVTDANGCTFSDNITVSVNAAPSANILPDPAVPCSGTNLFLNGNPSGSSGVYVSHLWTGDTGPLSSNNVVNPTFNSVSQGTYNLTYTVTDNLGCTGTDNISVTVTTTSDASFSYTSSTFCQSGVDPTPTVVTPGGTFSSSSVNLIINTSTGVIDLSASANGTYQVTYTTPAPCSASSNVTITITTAPDAEFSYNGPYCEGATNPLPSHVTGTNGIYTSAPPGLNFVNANTGEINLQTTSPGSYTITNTINVTGCGIATDNYNVTIYDSPNIGITPDPAATCSNTNLQLQGNPSGGTMPYSHTWTGNISFLSSTSISNPVFNAPAGGVYNFTYSVSDGHSCTSSDNISITVYNNPTASIIPMSANVCEGVNLQLNGNPVQGSGSIVSHLWTGSDTSPLSATNIVNPVFNASNNGVYTLYYTVTDNNGCTGRDTIIINVYNNPTVNITPAEPVNVCSGVSLQLNGNPVQGSAVIINHQWTGDFEPLSSTTIPNPVFTSGASGIYNLTYQVTDNNSCTASDNITINVQSSPSASITPNPASVCEGEDLQLNGNPSGGTGNYTHEWDGDYGPLSSTTIASPVFNTNTSGNYNLQYTVTDGNGCEGTSSITVSVYNNPSVVILPDKPEICAGTSLDLTANVTMGSGLPNDYEWTGNTGPLSSTTTTTTTFYTETPGSYFLQFNVGDVNGCGAMDTITVIVFPKPEADITPDPAIVCSGADLQLNGNPSGGSGIYMHDWDGATSSLSATNIENPVFNNDIEGNYQLTYMVVDDRGCSGIDIINIIVSPSPDLSTFVDSANCSVADGSAWVVASGGLTPYSYLWDDNSVNDTLYNVPAGLYSVTVTDANTCSSSVIVEIPNIGAGEVTIKLVNGIICFGGSDAILTVSMTGGTPPFDYYWLSGNDTIATTDTVYDLPAGPFEVGIWDAGLCFASDTFTVLQPPAINTTISPVHISCFGLTNGQASLSVSGGTPTYTYLWNTLQTTPIISNLSAGTYYVTVTDNYSCSIIDTAIIVEPAQILVNFQNITDITCYGYSDGAVTASGSGGVPGYTFNWSNLTTNATLSNVSAGSYIVTITDANGCTAKDTIELAQPDSLYLAGSSIDATCNNSNGQATVTVTDGTAPYSYEWEAAAGAQTTATAVNLSQGEYTVLVTDSNDCESNIDVLVGNVPSGTVTVTVNSHISCFGLSDGEMWASVTTGGNPPYTFLWSNTSNDTIISNLTAGAYNVTITDANNCSATGDDFISQPLALIIKSALHNVTCFGYSDGQIDLDVDNGTEPYSYLWSDSTTTEDLYYLSGDTFSVTVTDANGCIKIDSFVITEPDEIGLEWTSTEAVCYGTNTGSATVTASGGVGGYSYSWCSTAGYQTTAIATNLFGGYYYSVTVTDSTGCDMHIGNNVAQPTQIIIIDSATYVRNASCVENNDGKIIIGLEGGILPYHYEWSNGSSTDSLINITEGLYTVTVTDSHQCKFDTIFKVISAPENCLVIPHALTPNNDGKNDTWRIKNIQLYGNINIEIYNRWGNLVFSFDGTGTEYNDRSQQWAGKGPNGVDLPHGSYLFIIEFLDNSDLEPVTGAVSIIK